MRVEREKKNGGGSLGFTLVFCNRWFLHTDFMIYISVHNAYRLLSAG